MSEKENGDFIVGTEDRWKQRKVNGEFLFYFGFGIYLFFLFIQGLTWPQTPYITSGLEVLIFLPLPLQFWDLLLIG